MQQIYGGASEQPQYQVEKIVQMEGRAELLWRSNKAWSYHNFFFYKAPCTSIAPWKCLAIIIILAAVRHFLLFSAKLRLENARLCHDHCYCHSKGKQNTTYFFSFAMSPANLPWVCWETCIGLHPGFWLWRFWFWSCKHKGTTFSCFTGGTKRSPWPSRLDMVHGPPVDWTDSLKAQWGFQLCSVTFFG